MAYKDLQDFIKRLEEKKSIKQNTNPSRSRARNH